MLHWKNKPIDKLSKQELQQALRDSVGTLLAKNPTDQSGDVLSIFLMGLASGAVVAIIGVYLSSLI